MPDGIKFIEPIQVNPYSNQTNLIDVDSTITDTQLQGFDIAQRALEDIPLDKDPNADKIKQKILDDRFVYETNLKAQNNIASMVTTNKFSVEPEALEAYDLIGEKYSFYSNSDDQKRITQKFDKLNEEVTAFQEGRLTDEQKLEQERLKEQQSWLDVMKIQRKRFLYSFSAGSENYNPYAIKEWADHFAAAPLQYSIDSLIKGELTEEGKKDVLAQMKYIEENPIYKTGDERWWEARGLAGDLLGNMGFMARGVIDWMVGENIIKGIKLLSSNAGRTAVKNIFVKTAGKQIAAAAAREVVLTEADAALAATGVGAVPAAAIETVGTAANAAWLGWDLWKSGAVGQVWNLLKTGSGAAITTTKAIGGSLKLKRTAQSLLALQKAATLGKAANMMSKASLYGKIAEHTKTIVVDAVVSSSEAAVEGEFAYQEFMKENKNLYAPESQTINPNTGKVYTEKDVIAMAQEVRAKTYAWNFPVLMISNLFGMASVMRLSKLPKYLSHIPVSVKALSKSGSLVGTATSKYGTRSVLKTIGYNYFLKGSLPEGFEEIAQLHISSSFKKFYEKKLLTNSEMGMQELWKAGLSSWMSVDENGRPSWTEEGWQNFISGAAMGIIMPGLGGSANAIRLKQNKEIEDVTTWKEAFTRSYLGYSKTSTQKAVDRYNSVSAQVSSMIRQSNILKSEKDLLEADEVNSLQNYHDGIMTNAILLDSTERGAYFLDSLEEAANTLVVTESGDKLEELSDVQLENYFTDEKTKQINDKIDILFGVSGNSMVDGDIVADYKKAKTPREKANAIIEIAKSLDAVANDTKVALKTLKIAKEALKTDYEINSIESTIYSIYGKFGAERKNKASTLMQKKIKTQELSKRIHNDLIEQIAYVNYMKEHTSIQLKDIEEKVNTSIEEVYNSLSGLENNAQVKQSKQLRFGEIKTMFDFLKSDDIDGYLKHLDNKIETLKALGEDASKQDLEYYENSKQNIMLNLELRKGLTKREAIARHMISHAKFLTTEMESLNEESILDEINAMEDTSKVKKKFLKDIETKLKAKIKEEYIAELEANGTPFDSTKASTREKGIINKEVNKRYQELVAKQNKFTSGESKELEDAQAASQFTDMVYETNLYDKLKKQRYTPEEIDFLKNIQENDYFSNLVTNLSSFLKLRIYNQFAIKESQALSSSTQRKKMVAELTDIYLNHVQAFIEQKTESDAATEDKTEEQTITVFEDGKIKKIKVTLDKETREKELNNIKDALNNLEQINQSKKDGLLKLLEDNNISLEQSVIDNLILLLSETDEQVVEKTLTLLQKDLPVKVMDELKEYITNNKLLTKAQLEVVQTELKGKEYKGTQEDTKKAISNIMESEADLFAALEPVFNVGEFETICKE